MHRFSLSAQAEVPMDSPAEQLKKLRVLATHTPLRLRQTRAHKHERMRTHVHTRARIHLASLLFPAQSFAPKPLRIACTHGLSTAHSEMYHRSSPIRRVARLDVASGVAQAVAEIQRANGAWCDLVTTLVQVRPCCAPRLQALHVARGTLLPSGSLSIPETLIQFAP